MLDIFQIPSFFSRRDDLRGSQVSLKSSVTTVDQDQVEKNDVTDNNAQELEQKLEQEEPESNEEKTDEEDSDSSEEEDE